LPGKTRSRRGTGHLYQKDDRWYGQWYVRGKRVKRSLGPVKQPGADDGVTKRQAQARMLEAMAETDSAPVPVTERLTVEEVGKRRIRELARRGRKQDTTLANYESEIRCHFLPHFAQSPITEIGDDDIADFIDACLNDLSVKAVRNLYVHLNAIFEFAIRKRWCHANPCKLVDKPASVADDDAEIRFLDQAELDALLERAARARVLRDEERLQWKEIGDALGCSAATAMYLYRATADVAGDEDLWRVDLAMYLTAAMSGLRQGELLALRWRDVDWSARKMRVSGGMRNGKRRTPKSATSARAVPMADRVGGALDRLFQASAYQGDDDFRLRAPAHGPPARSQPGVEAVQAFASARRRTRSPLPRPETYVRNEDGGHRRSDSNPPGVDGPLRHQDDDGLHPLRARGQRGRPGQRRVRPSSYG
jgi:integrase